MIFIDARARYSPSPQLPLRASRQPASLADGPASLARRPRAGWPRRGSGAPPSRSSRRRASSRAPSASTIALVLGLIDGRGARASRCVASGCPRARPRERARRRRTSARATGCGWLRRLRGGGRESQDLELLGARSRSRRRPGSGASRRSRGCRRPERRRAAGADLRLDQPPRGHHLGRAEVVERPLTRVRAPAARPRRCVAADECAPSDLARDAALRLEDRQRVADHRARDSELRDELALRRQAGARRHRCRELSHRARISIGEVAATGGRGPGLRPSSSARVPIRPQWPCAPCRGHSQPIIPITLR